MSIAVQELGRLEREGSLEKVYWPKANLSINAADCWTTVALINEKVRIGANIFEVLASDPLKFEDFFCLFSKLLNQDLWRQCKLHYATFLVNLVQSLEKVAIRQVFVGKCLSLSLWKALSSNRLSLELKINPGMQIHWDKLQSTGKELPKLKKTTSKRKATEIESGSKDDDASRSSLESFVPLLIQNILETMSTITHSTVEDPSDIINDLNYVLKMFEWITGMLTQLITRRFLKTYLDDIHFTILSKLLMNQMLIKISAVHGKETQLLILLLEHITSLMHFEVNDFTGDVLSTTDIIQLNNNRLIEFQHVLYTEYGATMREVYFSSLGQLGKRDILTKHLMICSIDQLVLVLEKLQIIDTARDAAVYHQLVSAQSGTLDEVFYASDEWKLYLIEIACNYLVLQQNQVQTLNQMALYPTEELLFNYYTLPSNILQASNERTLSPTIALPKLGLQYLSVMDYLLRNFYLFQLENAYEVREDVLEAVSRMNPVLTNVPVTFNGWSKHALAIGRITMDEILKPNIGEVVPSRVVCTVTVDLSHCKPDVRLEWENLRMHDVLFLCNIQRPSKSNHTAAAADKSDESNKAYKLGVKYVRGGEVLELKDEDNVVLNDYHRYVYTLVCVRVRVFMYIH